MSNIDFDSSKREIWQWLANWLLAWSRPHNAVWDLLWLQSPKPREDQKTLLVLVNNFSQGNLAKHTGGVLKGIYDKKHICKKAYRALWSRTAIYYIRKDANLQHRTPILYLAEWLNTTPIHYIGHKSTP